MKSSWIPSAAVMFGCALSVGCGAPQRHLSPSDVRPLPYSGTMPDHINGFADRLNRAGSANEPVRILTVHGMMTEKPGFSEPWQKHIAERLNLRRRDTTVIPLVRDYKFVVGDGSEEFPRLPHDESVLRRTSWYDPKAPNVDRLIYYELLWAPFRDVVKNTFLGCFESRSLSSNVDCSAFDTTGKNRGYRYIVNALGKDELLVRGFGDATIVLSTLADVFRDDVDLAMCVIATDVLARSLTAASSERCDLRRSSSVAVNELTSAALEQTKNTLASSNFFVISHSLGSFLVLDGQQRAAAQRLDSGNTKASVPYALLDSATVFMFANQVSLLELGRFSVRCVVPRANAACENRALSTEGEKRPGMRSFSANDRRKMKVETNYVAFNDANDLLDFELPPYLAEKKFFGPLVNVTVENPGLRLWPFFKNPDAAHTRYGDNPAVIEAVVNGIDTRKPKD